MVPDIGKYGRPYTLAVCIECGLRIASDRVRSCRIAKELHRSCTGTDDALTSSKFRQEPNCLPEMTADLAEKAVTSAYLKGCLSQNPKKSCLRRRQEHYILDFSFFLVI